MSVSQFDMDRRNFLNGVAVAFGAAGIVAAGAASEAAADDGTTGNEGRVAILFNGAACVGCRYCEAACKKANGLDAEVAFNVGALDGTVYPKGLLPYEAVQASKTLAPVTKSDNAANRWLRVIQVGEGDGSKNVRHSCMHCGKCAEVCPSSALSWRDDGIVTFDPSRCIGCKYCYQACPFDIPRFAEEAGDKTIRKCTMCAERVDEGGEPACVEACPAGALKFGPWNDMAAAADAAVADAGSDACVYGKDEMGGMGVISVLPAGRKASGMPRVR